MFPVNNFSDELTRVLSFISSQLDRLNVLEQQLESQPHQQKLFYTKCAVMTKVCSVIINGDVCTNLASTYMVEKLGLTTTPHPHPYQFRSMDGEGEVTVREQVQLPFKIGGYVDTVTYDVIPMQSSHMLLGRPWQLGRGAVYDCSNNTHTLRHEGRKFKLISMTPEQIRGTHEDYRAKQAAHFGVAKRGVVREIEKPREVPREEADPTTLHLIRETTETVRPHLIPVEVYHYTVVEQQIVRCIDEVSTKSDRVAEQPLMSLPYEGTIVHHNKVVSSEEVVTFMELFYQEFYGRYRVSVIIIVQPASTWSGEGSKYLGVPFDPGKSPFPSSI